MPYNTSSKMLQRRQKILKQISFIEQCLELKREELESLDDVIRIRGPYHRGFTRNTSSVQRVMSRAPNVLS